jgi:hypothetical protein
MTFKINEIKEFIEKEKKDFENSLQEEGLDANVKIVGVEVFFYDEKNGFFVKRYLLDDDFKEIKEMITIQFLNVVERLREMGEYELAERLEGIRFFLE